MTTYTETELSLAIYAAVTAALKAAREYTPATAEEIAADPLAEFFGPDTDRDALFILAAERASTAALDAIDAHRDTSWRTPADQL